MKKIIVAAIIAVFLVPIISRSISYFRQNRDGGANVEPGERQLIGRVSECNPRVKGIQEILQSQGFEVEEVDGFMGPQTRQAIKKFQESRSLKPTGTIDQATLMLLEAAEKTNDGGENPEIPGSVLETKKSGSTEDTIEKNKPEEFIDKSAMHDEILSYRLNSKESIKKIQFVLKSAGFYKGEVDGKMGPRTKNAIKEFQKANKLVSDGIAGPRTWEALSQYLKN